MIMVNENNLVNEYKYTESSTLSNPSKKIKAHYNFQGAISRMLKFSGVLDLRNSSSNATLFLG